MKPDDLYDARQSFYDCFPDYIKAELDSNEVEDCFEYIVETACERIAKRLENSKLIMGNRDD